MQISLINGYYIEVGNRNFTLRKKYVGTSKDGAKKEYSKIISHCGSLEQALETFLRLNQIERGAKLAVDLIEYVSLVEQSNQEAVRALKSVLECNHDDVCEWKLEDEESNMYVTACEQRHLFFDGGPSENNYECCPYCGKTIKVVGNHEIN